MTVLIRPLITEKSLSQTSNGCYVFEVDKRANKHEIAEMIEDLYHVKIKKINIINLKGEKKLVRNRFLTKTKAWKKAIISLKKGQKIPGFEEKK